MTAHTADPFTTTRDIAGTDDGQWPRLPILATVSGIYIAVVAPAQAAALNPLGSTIRFVALAAAGFLAVLLAPRPNWLLRGCLATGAAFGVAAGGAGRTLFVWLAMALVLAAWTTAGRRPAPIVPRSAPGSAVPVAIASFVAVRASSQLEANWRPLAVLVAGGLVALAWTWLLPSPAATRLTAVGHGVDRVLTAAVAVPTGALAWLMVRLGSLVAGRDVAPGWVDPPPANVHSRSRRTVGRPARRVRPWAVPVAGIALVALVGWFVPFDGRDEVQSAGAVGVLPSSGPIPEAYRDDAWFPSFRGDMAWVMDERVAWRPMNVQRVLDVATPTVNVRDRARSSWTAPPCDCRRVTVWLYGGSGAFGVGQRDDHTIASELARAAAADGVALDVVNRGIPGQMHWRNSTRLAWDLTQSPPPDLVVFYEGAEEVASELELRERGLGNTLAPLESFITDLYDEVANVPDEAPPAPDGVSLNGWPTVDSVDREPGELAADRYERSRAMSRWSAAAADLPVRYFWQPSRFDEGDDAAGAPRRATVFQGAADALPDDVRDLSGTLADAARPVFYDDTNHNEFGAALVAAVVWRDLQDEVTALAREPL